MDTQKVAKPFYGKVILRGHLRAVTGLHIGAGRETLQIGGLDLVVMRDPITEYPYVPGSSLKGKLRSLLERRIATEAYPNDPSVFFNRSVGQVKIHVCDTKEDAARCPVCRIFGASAGRNAEAGSNFPSRLRVRDAFLSAQSAEYLRSAEVDGFTEIKSENAIDRITSAATPRTIERVPAGTDFVFEIVYDVENLKQLQEDLENLAYCLAVLEDDYLGGHGSRGYGKVQFLLSEVTAKKTAAYAGDPKAQTTVLQGPGVSRAEPLDKPEDQAWKTIADFRASIADIVQFFENEAPESS